MKAYQTLPAGYELIDTVNLASDKKTALRVNLAAAALMAVMAVPMHFVVPIGSLFSMEQGLGAYVLRIAVLLLGYIAYIALHELTHGAVMRAVGGGRVRFGFNGMYAWAGSETDFFDKTAYRCIALAPLVVWGLIFTILLPLASREWLWVVWWLQIGNVAGAAGDVYVTIRFAPLPKDILVRDTGIDMTVYAKGGSTGR